MQRLNANLYAVFLDDLKRDGPPTEYDFLYEDDICHKTLPHTDSEGKRNGRTLCESLRGDRLHVAQFLAYHRILWFNPEKGAIDQGKKGRPRMCKCDREEGGNAEVPRPRYIDA